MLNDVVTYLADPLTGEPLSWRSDAQRTLITPSGRCYDVAKQGFVTLFGSGRSFPGDTAHMVMNRAAFLASGLYEPLANRIATVAAAQLIDITGQPVLVDMGAGTGYYTQALQNALPEGTVTIAADISAPAAKRLAKLPGTTGALVANVWQRWPLQDACADLVTHIFAPRNSAEAARVLRPGGILLIATPTQAHLRELVAAGIAVHVDEQKTARLQRGLAADFVETICERCEWVLTPTSQQIEQIITMGPSSYHNDAACLSLIAENLASTAHQVHCSVEVRCYQRKDS